jgi:hypothetical protein
MNALLMDAFQGCHGLVPAVNSLQVVVFDLHFALPERQEEI